ncbi:MAG TPA: helix-turn-helix domain-containing protein [Rhizobiaceae bacterium]|nr:helix-turn-helix domain-containing protein [Rhizobiaceae bacterium]
MDGKFLLQRYRIHPDLDGLVWRISGYEEHGHALAGSVEVASLVVPLIIGFGDPFVIALGRAPGPNDRWGSFAAGLTLDPVFIDSTGHAEAIQIDFTPLGARRFFGLPMDELAGRMVTLDELGDRELQDLRQRLGESRDWESRFELAERFVLQRFRRKGTGNRLAAAAYRHMLESRGQTRIADLAGIFDCSRKHLAQSFRCEFGLPPKAVARIMRFQNALSVASAPGTVDWADVAFACGYADQAHLTREFAELAGTSPAQWHRAAADR